MKNSVVISADLSSLVFADMIREDNRLSIGRRGILLSIIGNEITGTGVDSHLDKHVRTLLEGKTPFFEFQVANLERNQLCITYNDQNNTVFLIGITDISASFATPEEIGQDHLTAIAVKMKRSINSGLSSSHVIFARKESVPTTNGGGSVKHKKGGKKAKKLCFYLLQTTS